MTQPTPKRRGRPSRTEPVGLLQTRVPDRMHAYIRDQAVRNFKTLTNAHAHIFAAWLNMRPYVPAMAWRTPKVSGKGTRWTLHNIKIPQDLASKLVLEAESVGVPLSVFLYTALWWYTVEKYPDHRAANLTQGAPHE